MRQSFILNKGFSLVELLVVVSIFIIISSVVLFNQNKFSSDISISNVAYSIALEIRQAQVSGILVGQGGSDFNNAYGVHFKIINSNKIVLQSFADIDGDLTYDELEGDAVQQLVEGNTILSVCTYSDESGTAGEECITPVNSGNIETVDIIYKRPDPSAIILDTLSSDSNDRRKRVEITIQSSLGDRTRMIKAYNTGQISVYNE